MPFAKAEIEAFDQNVALTKDEMRSRVPAIFATQPSPERSRYYRFINTEDVIDAMADVGFLPFAAMQTRSRKPEERQYAKHLIRFRQPGLGNSGNGEHFEIIIANSMNGQTAFDVFPGFFRFVCENGLILGSRVGGTRIYHSGPVTVMDRVEEVIKQAPVYAQRVEQMQDRTVSRSDQEAFVKAVLPSRFSDDIIKRIDVQQVLEPIRDADRSSDAWSVFNRVQERMVKGGVVYSLEDTRRASHTSRAIRGVKDVVAVNQTVWNAAEEYLMAA